MWSPFLTADVWTQYLVPGLIDTLKAAAISIVLAGVFGLLFGIGRLSQLAPVRWVCGVVVEFFRAVPGAADDVFAFALYSDQQRLRRRRQPALAPSSPALTLYNGVGHRRAGALRASAACPRASRGGARRSASPAARRCARSSCRRR